MLAVLFHIISLKSSPDYLCAVYFIELGAKGSIRLDWWLENGIINTSYPVQAFL